MQRSMFSRAGVILALMLAIAVVFPAHPLSAQTPAGPKTVTYDTPVEGQVTDAAPQDNWTLVSTGKDRISITVERTGGTLVPSVQILDTNNQRLAGADYDSTYARSVVRDYEFPSAGTYTVSVSRYLQHDGK